MAERKVNGKDVVISIKTAATFLLMVCQVEHNFERTWDPIPADSKCGPDQLPNDVGQYSISGTAQVLLGDGPTMPDKISEAVVDQLGRNRQVFEWKMGPAAAVPVPGDITYGGNGFFSSLSTSYPNGDVATFDFTLTVKGEYTQTIEPAAP